MTTTDTRLDLDALLDDLRRRHRIPGASLAVVTPDRLVHATGSGLADTATSRPATARTPYLWFSMTKLVTATAALRLADEGRLDLDAPVAEHVACFAGRRPQPTVRQLLDHTAGLSNPLPLRWVHPVGTAAPDPDALLERVMARRSAFRRRADGSARYSNVGYLALGAVIADVAGRPFEQHVREAVLEPTGMTRTGFTLSATAPPATGCVRAPRVADPLLRAALPRGVVGDRHGDQVALRPFLVDGPAYGGLVGDVVDAARFAQLHLRDGELDGRRVLSAGSARRMRVVDRPGRPFDHGLGWFRRPGARPDHVEHYGAGAGYWNALRLYPDLGLGMVVMASTTRPYDVDALFAAVRAAVA